MRRAITLMAASLLYIVEFLTETVHYRSPRWHGVDVVIPAKTVRYWETKIRMLFEEVFDDNIPKTVINLHSQCLYWLGLYAVDDANNRDEDIPEVVFELKQLGFLNQDGEIVSEELRAIACDVIRHSLKGTRYQFRLITKPISR